VLLPVFLFPKRILRSSLIRQAWVRPNLASPLSLHPCGVLRVPGGTRRRVVRCHCTLAQSDRLADIQLDHFRNARHYTNLCFRHNLSRQVCRLFSGAIALGTTLGLNG